jgi:CspA family cold shock protein
MGAAPGFSAFPGCRARNYRQDFKMSKTGIVKRYDHQRGFGFIVPDDGGSDVFVHVSAVERAGLRALVDGQRLSYEVVADRRSGRPCAGNLQVSNARAGGEPAAAEGQQHARQ